MKKLLTFLALTGFAAAYSQITITANLPSSVSTGSTIDADVKINKGAVGNFAKYQMDVPVGYIVSGVDVKGGNFTFENQRAKIVWVSVPGDAEFTVKFKIQVGSDAASPGTFAQKFYYLENNEKKEVEAAPMVVTTGGAGTIAVATPVASSTPAETTPATTTPANTTSTPPAETKPEETTPVASNPPPAETTPVTSTPPPAETKPSPTTAKTSSGSSSEMAGVTFKVQIGAYTTEPTKGKFPGAGNVNIEMINGLYKVTTGNFKTKDEAIKFRDELQAKGYSGFIVRFENGKRIN
jgi:cell division septation protein DedD